MHYGLQPALGLESAPTTQQKLIPKQITDVFTELREERINKDIALKSVGNLLNKLTGMTFAFKRETDTWACVYMNFTNNLKGYTDIGFSGLDNKTATELTGLLFDYVTEANIIDAAYSFDAQTLKFKGKFVKENVITIGLGDEVFENITSAQLTAFILHEVGHAVFSLATVGQAIDSSVILKSLTSKLLFSGKEEKVDVDVKKMVIEQAKKENRVKDIALLQSDACTAHDLIRISMTLAANNMTSLAIPSSSLQLRHEQFADYYVSWLGYSRHLVETQWLITRGKSKLGAFASFLSIASVLTAIVGFTGLWGIPISIIMIMAAGFAEEPITYDLDKERFLKQIRGARNTLRNADLSRDEKIDYLASLDAMEKRASKMSEWDNYLSVLSPFAIRNHNARRYEQRLEDFAQNPLLIGKLRLELS